MTKKDDKKLRKRDMIFATEIGNMSLLVFYFLFIGLVYLYSDFIILDIFSSIHNPIFIKFIFILVIFIPIFLYLFVLRFLVGGILLYRLIGSIASWVVGFVGLLLIVTTEDIIYLYDESLEVIPEITEQEKIKIKELQKEGKLFKVDTDQSTMSISIFRENGEYSLRDGDINLQIFIENLSNDNYGDIGDGYSKELSIVFPKQDIVINGIDLKNGEKAFSINHELKSKSISKGEIYVVDYIGKDIDKIKFFLRINGSLNLDAPFEIKIIDKAKLAIMNSSGKDYIAEKYDNLIKKTKFGFFKTEVISNGRYMRTERGTEFIPEKKSNFIENEILYFDDNFLSLALTINSNVFNNNFNIRKVDNKECEDFTYHNLLYKDGKEIKTYDYEGGNNILSNHNLCYTSNLIINVLD